MTPTRQLRCWLALVLIFAIWTVATYPAFANLLCAVLVPLGIVLELLVIGNVLEYRKRRSPLEQCHFSLAVRGPPAY